MGWLEVLERAERRKKKQATTHNTPPSKGDTAKDISQKAVGVHADKTDKRVGELAERRAERASKLGLIARWSYEFGYVSIHDPTTGEWHDVATKDAPGWAKWEAGKRKELKKHHGIHRLLSSAEIEEIWQEERNVTGASPAMTEKGIVYEDYLEEADA